MRLLDQSLCQLAGISPMAEIALRNKGIWTGRQLVTQAETLFSPRQAAKIREAYSRIELARENGLLDLLVNSMPCGHRVRVLADYLSQALFLDVETTGLSSNAQIVCISTCLNGKISSFVRGRNLEQFLLQWSQAGMLVTFNGKHFDMPLVQREFSLSAVPAHIDLRDEARTFGYVGGLKSIEEEIGFQRQRTVCTCGADAPRLWEKYCEEKDTNALDALVQYNQEDVRALTLIWRKILKFSLENTGIPMPV